MHLTARQCDGLGNGKAALGGQFGYRQRHQRTQRAMVWEKLHQPHIKSDNRRQGENGKGKRAAYPFARFMRASRNAAQGCFMTTKACHGTQHRQQGGESEISSHLRDRQRARQHDQGAKLRHGAEHQGGKAAGEADK